MKREKPKTLERIRTREQIQTLRRIYQLQLKQAFVQFTDAEQRFAAVNADKKPETLQ